jgi:uncharacterized membrane protein
MSPFVTRIGKTWLAGLLLLLPAALTVAVLGWVFSFVVRLVGPGTLVGHLFAVLGYPFTRHEGLSYLIGTLVLMGLIYMLGVLVQFGLRGPWQGIVGRTIHRIPLVGNLYQFAERFTGMLGSGPKADVAAMQPVWCFFGGGGAAVLALAPNPETLTIDGRAYRAVLVPTAPVPVGGALLYVPTEWVRPANIGVEKLSAVYVSMGLTAPPSPAAAVGMA